MDNRKSWSETTYTDALEDPSSQWDVISDLATDRASIASSSSDKSTVGGYFHSKIITFTSEDGKRSWNELVSIFIEDSISFLSLIEYDLGRPLNRQRDPISMLPGIHRDPAGKLRYRLKGVTPWDFDSLLTGLKPNRLGEEISYERLCPILVLATDWNFQGLRDYALQQISAYDDMPVPRIILARRAKVREWLLDAYVSLAKRPGPLNRHEAELLGVDSVLAVCRAREKVLERRLGLISGPTPSKTLGRSSFWHSHCYYILAGAWRRALTESKYETMTPCKSMMAALEDMDRAGEGRALCKYCSTESKIVLWLDLDADTAVAQSALEDCLCNSIERWSVQ